MYNKYLPPFLLINLINWIHTLARQNTWSVWVFAGEIIRSCLKVHTSDHTDWPRVTTNVHEWPRVTASRPRVTTSDYEWPRVRMHQNILLMSWWRHHFIILSNNHYFTANWPFLETLIPGFDISAISDWMGERLGDGQGGGGVQTSRHPHPLISVPATFLSFFFPRFFPPPVHLPPSFLPGVPNSNY